MHAGILRVSAIAVACVAIGACADTTKAGAGNAVSLSFSTAPSAGASFSSSADVTPAPTTDNLQITSAQVLLTRMELETTAATCTSDAVAGDDDEHKQSECEDLQVGPTIVSLPIGTATTTALQGAIPAGSYSALEARIRPIRSDNDKGNASSAFLTANPDWAGKSLIVKGTLNGKDFTYAGTPRAEFETVFNPPLTVGTDPVNITIHVDMSKWFLDSSGAVIDPSTTDPVKLAQIGENIRRSFRAFRDNNRDGHEDHN